MPQLVVWNLKLEVIILIIKNVTATTIISVSTLYPNPDSTQNKTFNKHCSHIDDVTTSDVQTDRLT